MNLENLDVMILLVVVLFALFVPDIIEGIRNYRRGRDLARQTRQEQEARDFLDKDWQRRHRDQWDDWK
jgi:hypothetical protein